MPPTAWCTPRPPGWPRIPGCPCRRSCCARTCGSPTSSTGPWRPSWCAPPGHGAAGCSTAAEWPSTRRSTPSDCSPAWSRTPSGCGPTSPRWSPSPASTPVSERGFGRSIATVCLSGTLEDKLGAAAAAGFDGIEVFEPDLVASPWSPAELAARCADLGLSIDLYQPFRDLDSTDPDRFARNLRRAERKFDVMAALDVDTVLVCSSVAPDAVEDADRLAGQLAAAAARAGERGLRIAYEALAWGRHMSTWERSWDAVRRADSPALGMCLDSFHVLSRGGDPAGFADVPGEKLFFLQLADAPRLA